MALERLFPYRSQDYKDRVERFTEKLWDWLATSEVIALSPPSPEPLPLATTATRGTVWLLLRLSICKLEAHTFYKGFVICARSRVTAVAQWGVFTLFVRVRSCLPKIVRGWVL